MIPTIETSRLTLRPFTPHDAPRVHQLASAYSITEMTQIRSDYSENDALDWILAQEDLYFRKIEMALAITDISTGELMGAVTLTDIFVGHQAELGFWIGESYRGNGYAVEASRAVIDFAFGEPLNLIRVHAFHLSKNHIAGQVLKQIGMSHEGTCPKHFLKNNIPEDIELWGVVRTTLF